MGLQLNVSNSLLQLADGLAEQIKEPLPTIFHSHFIVTQTDGMNNWLKIEIAKRLNITANVQFLKPNDIINHIYYLVGGPFDQVLGTSSLQWIIYEIFNDKLFKNRFKDIADYYVDNDLKRMSMAEKVADLFDQYQIYRPEMILEWNANAGGKNYGSNWQQYLWRACVARIGDRMPDKTRVGKFIVEALSKTENQQKLKERLPQINFFGISIITTYHLQIFNLLAQYINVSFNLLNPAPKVYWFEDKSEKYIAKWKSRERDTPQLYEVPIEGNSLLTNWGKVIQDTFSLFFEEDVYFNQYEDKGSEPQSSSLLGKLQNDIYNNAIQDNRNKLDLSDLNDGSISINSCFTPVREVEALYNYLTQLVDTNPDRNSPRDIVVMVTDIDLYAPYIKAVFNSAPYKFPYTIADERLDSGDSLFGAVNAFLELDQTLLKAEDVLQLLDWDYIKRRFQLTDVPLLRRAVDAANIRFGIEGDVANDTVHVSWLNGLNRIMYGVCLYGEEEYGNGDNSFFPVDLAEGEKAEELIRFTHFVNILIDSLIQQNRKRNLNEWGEYIINVVNNLIYFSEDDENHDYQVLLSYVEKLNLLALDSDEKISYAVFKHNFLTVVSGESRSGNFASGGITFCSLIPMRSIPFKIVALLGMNSAQFPRNEVPNGFNLMRQHPKKGDRNIKDNDKHLFLETILSAQDRLFISFIGRNVKDNSTLPPSILVDELVDYIISGVSNHAEEELLNALIVNHPLQNFSVQPNGIQNYYTSGNEIHDIKRIFLDNHIDSSRVETFNEVTVQNFIRFFKDPFEHYYNHILHVNYKEKEILLRETEWFELDSLQQWVVRNDLLYLNDKDVPEYIRVGIKKGDLPLKNAAVYALNQLAEEVNPTKERLEKYKAEFPETRISIHLEVDQTVLSGSIERVYNDALIMVLFSKNSHKYLLELYIYYIIARACGHSINAFLIDHNSEKVHCFSNDACSQLEAFNKLEQLMQLYKEAHQNLFLFHPGFEHDPTQIMKMEHRKFIKQAESLAKFNPYILNEYKAGLFEKEEIYQQYLANSSLIFSHIYSILQ